MHEISLTRSSICSTYTWLEKWSLAEQERTWERVIRDAQVPEIKTIWCKWVASKLGLQVRGAGSNPLLVHFNSSCTCIDPVILTLKPQSLSKSFAWSDFDLNWLTSLDKKTSNLEKLLELIYLGKNELQGKSLCARKLKDSWQIATK